MDNLCVLLLSVVIFAVPGVDASHFRGAIISWRPGFRENEIIIDYRISWRRSSGGNYCNSSIIQSGDTVTGEGTLSCFYNCRESLGSLHYQCTDYSITEDWTSGKGRVIHTLTLQNTTNFEFGYASSAWIGGLNVGSGNWELRVKGDLAVRNDTGTINSSPRTEISPIVRLQYGCHHTIRLPVSDADQDIVKCRWASGNQSECGGVCNGLPNAFLNQTACTLTYDASYSTGWYAVAIQVEDFANQYDSQPLSSIPVQFLVQVYRSYDSCFIKPEFIDPSPQDGACIVVPINETFETTITANTEDSNRSIAEIQTTSPLGMIKSPLMQINETTWQVNVTWEPTAINDTSNVFCFTATDTSGQQSERRCITLLSGVSKPKFMDGYGSPVGIVSPDQRRWTIEVDSPFVRGAQHAYIRLYSNSGSLLETIDASDRRRITLNSYNQSVEFTTSTTLHENQAYFFLFDSGVVRSASYCGADSEEVTDPYFWRFSTEAVPIRLVDGPRQYSGRVEVFHGGAWGTICDDNFDRDDAEVICRMLGMLTNASEIEAFGSAHFGQGSGRIVLDDLQCYGYESSIENCRSNGWMNENCGHEEDAGVSCQRSPVRLVNGYNRYSGRVEVYHDGEWGTVCDDDFDRNDAKVICRQLGMYYGDSVIQVYTQAYFGPGSGRIALDDLQCSGIERSLDDCMSQSWFTHNCAHSEDAGVHCRDYIYATNATAPSATYYTSRSYFRTSTTTYRPWYLSTAGYDLTDAIQVSCGENGWDIRVNLAVLRNIHPGTVASDIYLGENSCTGVESWNTVIFQQGLHECLTSQMIRNNVLVYRNQLVYAQRDPAHPFIIRSYNWTVSVECDVDRNETSSGHIHHDTGNNPVDSVLGSSHYFVNMSFYSDPNFMYRIQGNPIHVTVGSEVYVKVYTTTSDWTVKMRVHTCYTKPSATASDHLKYEIIKNGCEMDSNTHIISQSSHETRFVFQDFEYTSNHDGLYVFCDAIFCRTSDYSRQCMQTCNP